jgi:hypothetical protein
MIQSVEALRYNPEGRWLDSRWCPWTFCLTILRASKRPYADKLPLLCADCLEIWHTQAPGTFRACNRPVYGLLYQYITLSIDIGRGLLIFVR